MISHNCLFIICSLPLGMKKINCSWVSDERLVHRLSCPHRFYQVIACTLVFSLQLPMLLPQIAVSLYFIIQGEVSQHRDSLNTFSGNPSYSNYLDCRASPSEFVIPLAKYVKAVYHTRVSVGMRFRMLFETEESSVRRQVTLFISYLYFMVERNKYKMKNQFFESWYLPKEANKQN